MIALNPQIGNRLQVVLRSPRFIKNLVSIVDYLNPEFVDQVEKSLHNMHLTKDGQQLLMIFRVGRYFPFKSEFLVDTERVFNRYMKMNPEFDGESKEYQKSN